MPINANIFIGKTDALILICSTKKILYMKKLYILTLLTCLIPQQIHAIEPSVFKKAEPEDPNQTRVAIELSTAEKLFIKVTEGIIVVLVDEPISLREKGTLTESCRFDFSFIKKTQVSSDSFLSSDGYKILCSYLF